jgi:hypothetical protein
MEHPEGVFRTVQMSRAPDGGGGFAVNEVVQECEGVGEVRLRWNSRLQFS